MDKWTKIARDRYTIPAVRKGQTTMNYNDTRRVMQQCEADEREALNIIRIRKATARLMDDRGTVSWYDAMDDETISHMLANGWSQDEVMGVMQDVCNEVTE